MKTKRKNFIRKTVLLIADLAISASGINEAIDIKKLVTDFFMYSYLLLLHLRNRIANTIFHISLRMPEYKGFVACLLLVPAYIAFIFHSAIPTILTVFVLMILTTRLMKKKAAESRFTKGSLP